MTTNVGDVGGDERAESLEDKAIETYMNQILAGVAEALKKLMENENRSSFNTITLMALLSQCLEQDAILLKKRCVYNILSMAKNEAVLTWKRYTGLCGCGC